MVRYLSGGGDAVANLYDYGIPVFNAGRDTPRRRVRCTAGWGTCDLERGPVPVPAEARPHPGSDGAMVVVDHSTGRTYEFWRARRDGASWTARWGGVAALPDYRAPSGEGTLPTGAGVSRLAGVVRLSEVRNGRIPHALVLSTDNACRGAHRHPAVKSDGRSSRADCVPEGARIQLDPRVDLGAIRGMSRGERMVARALQTYGAYVIDNGAARMAFSFERPRSKLTDPYPNVGLHSDYYHMDRIPWGRLRVLRSWDGG
ncbi:hypothetical protein BH23ACT7_BH23ACT7_28090 [soil metagenome]